MQDDDVVPLTESIGVGSLPLYVEFERWLVEADEDYDDEPEDVGSTSFEGDRVAPFRLSSRAHSLGKFGHEVWTYDFVSGSVSVDESLK